MASCTYPFAVTAPARLIARLSSERPDTVVLSEHKRDLWSYLRALRPHQWLKNSLIAYPHRWSHVSFAALFAVLVASRASNLGASSVYLVNDMLDLPHDRVHPEKRRRPFAAGVLAAKQRHCPPAITALLSIGLHSCCPGCSW